MITRINKVSQSLPNSKKRKRVKVGKPEFINSALKELFYDKTEFTNSAQRIVQRKEHWKGEWLLHREVTIRTRIPSKVKVKIIIAHAKGE